MEQSECERVLALSRSLRDDIATTRHLRTLELAEVDSRYARKIAALEKQLAELDAKGALGANHSDPRTLTSSVSFHK